MFVKLQPHLKYGLNFRNDYTYCGERLKSSTQTYAFWFLQTASLLFFLWHADARPYDFGA